jgi:hypothetical protein
LEKARQYSALTGGALLVLALSSASAEEGVMLASGLALTPLSAEMDPEMQALRLRYMSAEIGAPGFDLETLSADMEALCHAAVEHQDLEQGALVIISISDREVALGVIDPEAVQVFQSFEYTGQDCIWSHF